MKLMTESTLYLLSRYKIITNYANLVNLFIISLKNLIFYTALSSISVLALWQLVWICKLQRKIFNLDLKPQTLDQQYILLSEMNILPFRYRLFYRFSIFSFKIMNELYLENIKARVCHLSNKNIRPQRTASLNKYIQKNIMDVITTRTKSGEHSLSFFLISFINLVIKDSFLLEFTLYKKFISTNFSNLFDSFSQLFKNEH